MNLKSLLRLAGKQYLDGFDLDRVWQTVDGHGLALLTRGSHRYVLKSPFPYTNGAFYARSLRSMQATAVFLRACSSRGLPVAPYLPNRHGELVTTLPGPRYCYLMEWVPHVEGASLARSRYRSLASVHARLHLCAATLDLGRLRRHSLTEVDFRANLRRLSMTRSRISAKLFRHGVTELDHLRSAWSETPTGICHNDLGETNLLVDQSGDFTVLDFDFSDRNLFASDLARTIGYLSRRGPPSEARRLISGYLNGYCRSRPLSRRELRVLGAVLLYAGFLMYPYVRGRIDDLKMIEWLGAFRAAGIPAGPNDIS